MHWVLQNNLFDERGWDHLVSTLERLGIPYSVHKVVPFVGELVPPPEVSHSNVICVGSYSLRHEARRHGWSPGVFDLADIDFTTQREHWGSHLLNANARISAFGDAVVNEPTFIRPTNDSKCFTGRVIEEAEFTAWQRAVKDLGSVDGSTLTPDTSIMLATPEEIHAEYRCWVVRGKVVTSSLYKRGARVFYQSDVDPLVVQYAQARVAEWAPCEAFVLDVCDTPRGMRIVEINTLNAAGFYAADLQQLVFALEEAFHRA